MNVLSSDTENSHLVSCPSSSSGIQKRTKNYQVLVPLLGLSRSPIVVDRKTTTINIQKRKQRQPWSKEEDELLSDLVKNEGGRCKPNWTDIAEKVNDTLDADRAGKQCRERWQNHLRPNIKKGNWSIEEEEMIRNMYQTFGPKWSCMAKLMKDRTDNDIKNKWNSMMRTQKAHEARYGYAHAFKAAVGGNSQTNERLELSGPGQNVKRAHMAADSISQAPAIASLTQSLVGATEGDAGSTCWAKVSF